MANLNLPERAMRQQIASAIHAVVQIARLSDGTRKVITVSEVTGMEGELFRCRIFLSSNAPESTKAESERRLRATGIRPRFANDWLPAVAACAQHYLSLAWRSRAL